MGIRTHPSSPGGSGPPWLPHIKAWAWHPLQAGINVPIPPRPRSHPLARPRPTNASTTSLRKQLGVPDTDLQPDQHTQRNGDPASVPVRHGQCDAHGEPLAHVWTGVVFREAPRFLFP